MASTAVVAPNCWLGYSRSQVEAAVGDRLAELDAWMEGKRMGYCDGLYHDERNGYQRTRCWRNPHGMTVFADDIETFLDQQ